MHQAVHEVDERTVTTSDIVSAEDFGTLAQLLPHLSEQQIRDWQHQIDEALGNAERYADIDEAEKAPVCDQLVSPSDFPASEYEFDGAGGYDLQLGYDPNAYAVALSESWLEVLEQRAGEALKAERVAALRARPTHRVVPGVVNRYEPATK